MGAQTQSHPQGTRGRSGVQGPHEDRSTILYVSPHIARELDKLIPNIFFRVTIWINICTAVIILLPSISPTIREIVTYPSVAIINIMASRAFQQLRIETLNGCVTTFSIEADPSGRGHHNLSTVDIELQFASPSSLQSPVVSGEASDNPRRSSSSYGWSKTGTLSEA